MIVRRAEESDRASMARFAARLQARPEHHVCYLGADPAAIAEEMIEDVDDWTEAAVVAERGGDIVGWLEGSIDHDMGRVWWFGPFVDADDPARWGEIADALDETARRLLRSEVTEEEWAFDSRHLALGHWAVAVGTVETGSAVLSLAGPLDAATTAEVRPLTAADRSAVAALHDLLFPGTHVTGATLVSRAPEETRCCLVVDGPVRSDTTATVAGYVVVERQPDGDGYIDFVGVDPRARRAGLGSDLVRAGVAESRRMGCETIHLTVRADNDAARRLYARLGFGEERVIVPVRRGFSLG